MSYHIISYPILSYPIISYHIVSYYIISYHINSYHISLILQFFLFDGWDPSIYPLPATLEEDSQPPEIDKLIPTEINQNPSSLLSTSISLLFDRTLYKQAIRSRIHLPKREELLFLTLGIGTTQASMLPSLYLFWISLVQIKTQAVMALPKASKIGFVWMILSCQLPLVKTTLNETKGWFELYT